MVTQVILKHALSSIYSSFLWHLTMFHRRWASTRSWIIQQPNQAKQLMGRRSRCFHSDLRERLQTSLPGGLIISTLRIIQSSQQVCLGLSCPLYTSATCNCVLRSCAFILSLLNENESQCPPSKFLSQVALLSFPICAICDTHVGDTSSFFSTCWIFKLWSDNKALLWRKLCE